MKMFELIELLLNATWTIVSILSVIISIASVIISTILAFRVERLKTELEIEKNKAILNDSKIREAYETFIYSFINFDDEKNIWKINEWIKIFTKNMLLFSWYDTIQAINKYKLNTNDDRIVRIWLAEDIFCAMRKDLWVSNHRINHWDLIQFLVKSDVSSILNNKKS